MIGLGSGWVADRVSSSRPVGTLEFVNFLDLGRIWRLFRLGIVLWYPVLCINYYILLKEVVGGNLVPLEGLIMTP